MRRMVLVLGLLFPAVVFAQGGAVTTSGIVAVNALGRPVGGATVTICAYGASGIPCSPTITVYTDPTLLTPASNPAIADGNGNVYRYANPGRYTITVTGTGITGTSYTATVAGSGGGDVVSAGTNVLSGSNTFTGGLIISTTPYSTSSAGTHSGTETFTSINNTCFADTQAGADMGIKIAACATSLPSTGGIIDATGFQGTQTWSTNIFSGVTKPVMLKLGPANIINVNVTQSPANRNIKIIGGGSANGAGALTALVVGFASGDVFAPTAAAQGFELSNVSVTTSVTRTSGFVVNPAPGAHYGYVHDLYLSNQYGGFKIFAGGGVGLSLWHFQNIQWGVTSAALHCGSVFTIGSTDNTISAQDTFLEDFVEVGDVGIHDAPEFLFDGNTDTVKLSNIDMGYSASSTATQPVFKFQNTLGGGFPPRWIRLLNSSEEAGTGAAGADIVSIDSGLNLVFEGVYAVNADHGYKISCGATCHGIKITNGVIGNNNNGGIYVTGGQLALGLSIIGNDFFGNSKAVASTTDDINIADANTQFSIIGNSFGQITGTIGTTNNTRYAIFLSGTVNSTNYTITGNHTQTSKYTSGFINGVTIGSNFVIQTDEGRTLVNRGPGSARHWFLGGAANTNWQIAAQEAINNGFEITPSTASGGTTFTNPAVSVAQNGNGGSFLLYGSTSGSTTINPTAAASGTATFPAATGTVDLTSNTTTTTTQVLHGSATAGVGTWGAIVTADIATALTTPGPIGGTTPSTGKFSSMTATNLLWSTTAPTIAGAGCGGSGATISANNGTAAFSIGTGTAPTSACTITMPAATTGWVCDANTVSATSTTNFIVKQTGAVSTTSVVLTLFTDVAATQSYTASDTIRVKCSAY